MSLPTLNELQSFEITPNGLPVIFCSSNSNVLTDGSEFAPNGLPIFAILGNPSTVLQYNASQFFMLF